MALPSTDCGGKPFAVFHPTRLGAFFPPAGSPGFVEQLAADQHAAYFAGAGTDLVELGVAQQATGGEFVDVAVAAEDLDRSEEHTSELQSLMRISYAVYCL